MDADEDVDPDALTRSALPAPDTQSVQAWGLDEDWPEDDEPRGIMTPGRITAAAVLLSLIVVTVAGLIVWQHMHQDVTITEPSLVRAEPPRVIVKPAPPTVTVSVPPPVTVTVAAPAPPVRTVDPPAPNYDGQFLRNLVDLGWQMTDVDMAVSTAHKVCDGLRQGYSMSYIYDRITADDPRHSPTAARQFADTAVATYPNCP